MNCRLLRAGNDVICAADKAPYVPSVFERTEYCLSARHRMCPFYCRAMSDGYFDLSGMNRELRA